MDNKDEKILRGRFLDLAKRAYSRNIYTYTDFLGLGEQSLLHSLKKDISFVETTFFGGFLESERVMVAFGNSEELGYLPSFPISCLHITPLNLRFSEKLTHRDCLGAIMNLGIERELVGDIIVGEREVWIFCANKIKNYIKENLCQIRKTLVMLSDYDADVGRIVLNLEKTEVMLSSLRLDALISKVFNLSRDKGVSLFKEGRVFINGKVVTGNVYKPKNGDIISVRGMGRFKYNGELRETKKGKLVVLVAVFV